VSERIAEFFRSIRSGHLAERRIPETFRPRDLAQGYSAQAELVKQLLERNGGCAIGYKVACTSSHAQELLGTDGPVFGRLLSSMMWPGGSTISSSNFPMLVVEPEFAFTIVEDVPSSKGMWTRETIEGFVGDMVPSIELVGHGFSNWAVYDTPSLVADNAVHQGWVHGVQTDDWKTADLARWPVSLEVDGRTVRKGCGANVLGHPLNAVAWLAGELRQFGLRLRSGDRVTTGVCTEICPVRPGQRVVADFGSLGSVDVTFS